MKRRTLFALLVAAFGGFLFCQTAPVKADEPPLWMVGKFHGLNKLYKSTTHLTISDDGTVTAKTKIDARKTINQRGVFEGRKIILNGMTFDLQWRREGFRLTQRDDPDNATDYTRMDDYSDRPEHIQQTPSWMTGVLRGTNRKYLDAKMTFLITPNGRVTAIAKFPGGRERVQRGYYDKGSLMLDGEAYEILSRRDGSVRIREYDDPANISDVRLVHEEFGRDPDMDLPPSWLAAVFVGYNHKYDSDIVIEIQPSGKVISHITHNGERSTAVGSYRRGRIRMVGGLTYDIERVGDGVKFISIVDERDADVYRRR